MKRCDGKYARNPTRNICRACIRRPKIAKENCKKTCKWFILAFIFFTGLKTRGKKNATYFLHACLLFWLHCFLLFVDRFAFPEPGFWILLFYFASSEISTKRGSGCMHNYENCPPPQKKKTPINAANRPNRPTSRNRPLAAAAWLPHWHPVHMALNRRFGTAGSQGVGAQSS